MRACSERGLGGLRFCLVKDTGKYRGTQYFAVAPEAKVPRFMCGDGLDYHTGGPNIFHLASPDLERIRELGGSLPKVADIFANLFVQLENCYLREDMPDAYFAYGYRAGYYNKQKQLGLTDLLIRSDAAEQLLACHAIAKDQISPVYVTEDLVPGYLLKKSDEKPFPVEAALASRFEAYRDLSSRDRPRNAVTEKEALGILRSAKRRRKDDFRSALPKKQRELLVGTEYEPLIPYYSVCESGCLSDEYDLLSCLESPALTREAVEDLEKEELKNFTADGIVIALAPDGDKVMLTASKEVIRLDHEGPGIIGHWNSLAEFIAEETT